MLIKIANVSRRRLLSKKAKLLQLLYVDFITKKNKYKKTVWIRKLFEEREQKGEFNMLVKDMKLFDSEWFFRYFRMSPETFEQLLSNY